MTLTILELLYIVLIVFGSIIGTLLIIVLLRVLKILGPITEMVGIYDKIKNIIGAYSSIPDILKEKAKEMVKGKKD